MQNLNLFEDIVIDAPLTEGIKYAGSKRRLLPHILQLVNRVKPRIILDGFSGTTRVSQALAQSGYRVVANDVSDWSKIFGTCYLLNTHSAEHYRGLVEYLNSLEGRDGWFTEHYGGDPNHGNSAGVDSLKKPWQKHNTRKLDAVREEIEKLSLDSIEKSVLLTSLILALDQVDSTMGHFASYLSDWSPRSYKKLQLEVPRLVHRTEEHSVYQRDIFDLLHHTDVDLAYYDPPYGSNNEKMPPSRVRYAAYYHVWTSICLFDKPAVFGKAKRRIDTSDNVASSVFEEFRRSDSGRFVVLDAIERLIRETHAKHIILSYSSGGRATARELNDVIRSSGRLLDVMEINHQRNVMAGMRWTHEWVRDAEGPNKEFLFLIETQT